MVISCLLQAIAVSACIRDSWPVLILTPSSLRLHWASVSFLVDFIFQIKKMAFAQIAFDLLLLISFSFCFRWFSNGSIFLHQIYLYVVWSPFLKFSGYFLFCCWSWILLNTFFSPFFFSKLFIFCERVIL
jgi:hypothetical protein